MKVFTDMIKVLDGQNRDNSDKSIIESVGKEGVLVPLLVYSDPEETGKYVLVAGHRRLASAVHFNLKEVPVEVIPQDQAERARALENLDRKGLHPLDEATEIRTLQRQGYDNGVIAAMLGMELPKVIRRSKLNNLSPEVKKEFLAGKMDASVAEELSVMEPEAQESIWGHARFGNYDARAIRSMYLEKQGLSLDGVCERILKITPSCAECPHNAAASDPLLFPGTMGSCKDPSCYCRKLKSVMDAEKVQKVLVPDSTVGESFSKALKDNKIRSRKIKNEWNLSTDPKGTKVLLYDGRVRYEDPAETKKKDPAAAERRKVLKQEYEETASEFFEEMGLMMAEFADSWYAKNHKGEPLPDKDERMVLTRKLLDEQQNLTGFLYGQYYHNGKSIMDGADNRRRFSIAMLFSLFDGKQQTLYPTSLRDLWHGAQLELPEQIGIEETLQLKTSKHRKKVQELAADLKKILKEYKDLEGK